MVTGPRSKKGLRPGSLARTRSNSGLSDVNSTIGSLSSGSYDASTQTPRVKRNVLSRTLRVSDWIDSTSCAFIFGAFGDAEELADMSRLLNEDGTAAIATSS